MQDARYAPPQAHVADVDAASDGPLLATRWQRFGALLIDGALAFASFWVAGKLLPWDPWAVDPNMTMWTPTPVASIAVGLGAFVLLHGYLLVKRGQTVGKFALGIRITRPDGSLASWGRVLGLRYLLGYVATILPVLGQVYGLVDCLTIFRSNRRCLHDVVADTIVVKA
ncbi:MAG TPA: RDD family protein [Ramlibacter sp.]|uniref:RDD family protein n=1 Tax=Ramlibacter sp. TaxID=1917967 RepID=UPI002ED1D798